ncbi:MULTISPECIES: protocatechuate 3,4-dioxygenase subunit alpha [unclassified Rhodococcus (in: high G+C Gram-positive bacteria)]|uniref:protocatechuate 3,4-dioxygenase subunit alpha n=1 Tax=unclassified Rhodococcus (in: high G+C Gram-positive bacteria) TaxID=192944 RepID=UPI00092B21FA|nr:protocatechuate 3,4-dioxygenase subunit alpha [Rhodococcus sp. M8]OLL17439.1 protocatechuate 3,4-dioxygenase subunit alpha [Rhodococcus sp. M8]QPG45709.1 protocatechuate 3,4-dioxygenase subunit alpha [Rhodococcus sp. M8]
MSLSPHSMIERRPETPSQTGGPYVHIGLAPQQAGFDIFDNNFGNVLTTPETKGEHITLEGRVFDGTGTPVRDVLIEIWQANAAGRYAHPGDTQDGHTQDRAIDPTFRGWGRTGGDFDTGVYTFETIKPGPVPANVGGFQAPHILMVLFARGINIGLHTRVYFDDEADANAADPVLDGIEWEVRRDTLIAKRSERDGKVVYTFDVRLQDTPEGGIETVFFDI